MSRKKKSRASPKPEAIIGRAPSLAPRICLNMIVRNEAHIIREALQSVQRYVTDFVIVDTGSTDDTQRVIGEFFDALGVSGHLVERPFRNFGDNRTEALELARELSRSDYVWVLDADDRVLGNVDLNGLVQDAYHLRIGPDFEYFRLQIFRRTTPWRYVGVVHEYAVCDTPQATTGFIEGEYHVESRRLGDRSRDPHKYERDAALLEDALRKNPNDPRSTFYLAQSLFDAGDIEKARAVYLRRVELGGWDQEVFYSRYRAAQCLERLGRPWPVVRRAYLDCFAWNPERAEPLVRVAHREREAGRFAVAHVLAKRASEVPRPGPTSLFVDRAAYDYRARDEMAISAFYLGQYQAAFDINTELLRRSPLPDAERRRIERNRDFSVPHLQPAFAQYDDAKVRRLNERARSAEPLVTLTITTCRRLELFDRTVTSFLNACEDVDRIDRFICIDDNSAPLDREEMERRFAFFEFAWKGPEDRGHARSMNLLLDHVRTPFWLHLEDDFMFFERLPYVGTALEILQTNERLGQVLFNRHYAEGIEDRDIVGGELCKTTSGMRYVMHTHAPLGTRAPGMDEQAQGPVRSNAWWPHFSLRPSMLRVDAARRVGRFDERAPHFELDFAQRYAALGLQSAFFDSISSLHIGRRTSERDTGLVPNAYELNGVAQFGRAQASTARVTVTVTTCKRPELFFRTIDSFRAACQDVGRVADWICVDDGSTADDRRAMAERFPFFRFVLKDASEQGHAKSMNRVLDEVRSRYVLHLEDDWEFTKPFRIGSLLDLLLDGTRHQVIFSRRPGTRSLGPWKDGLDVHEYVYDSRHPSKPELNRCYDAVFPDSSEPSDSGWWWPGFSLNPSLFDVDFFRTRVGRFDERIVTDLFEYDYAVRAHAAGGRVLCTDLGVAHIGAVSAYALTGQRRWWDATVALAEGS